MLRRVLIAVLAILASHMQALAAGFDHSDFDRLLERYVLSRDEGVSTTVDYTGIKQSKAELARYLAKTESIDRAAFDAWSKADQLAFLINVYNARTIELVLEGYPGISSIKDLGSTFSSPWSKDVVTLFGEKFSLDDVEHGLIRGSGRYGDPRIHFAVNCASIGCPALRNEAYIGEKLDEQLEDQTWKFLSDRSRNRLKGSSMEVSSIFKWYGEDFESGFRGTKSIGQFLALYSKAIGLDEAATGDLREGRIGIRYLKYDWRLNAAK